MIPCSFARCVACIIGLTALPCLALAQDTSIPNHSFEGWTGTEPDFWFTSNHPELELSLVNITQTTRAQDGMYAVRGEVATVSVFGTPSVYGPQIHC